MRFSIAAASTALLALAEARITGFKVPKEIKIGEAFEATILREGYIQSVYDSSIVFGYAAGDSYPGTVGTVVDSVALGKSKFRIVPKSSQMTNRNKQRSPTRLSPSTSPSPSPIPSRRARVSSLLLF